MPILRILLRAVFLAALALPALAADDILDAIDQARKAYQAGDMANAKQSLDLASQLVGQKNAESFAALLPAALPGWKAEKAETHVGRRRRVRRYLGEPAALYRSPTSDDVQVRITGDSAHGLAFRTACFDQSGDRRRDGQAGQHRRSARDADQRRLINMVVANKFSGAPWRARPTRHPSSLMHRPWTIAKLSKM